MRSGAVKGYGESQLAARTVSSGALAIVRMGLVVVGEHRMVQGTWGDAIGTCERCSAQGWEGPNGSQVGIWSGTQSWSGVRIPNFAWRVCQLPVAAQDVICERGTPKGRKSTRRFQVRNARNAIRIRYFCAAELPTESALRSECRQASHASQRRLVQSW
jgi:hypothetical protein